MCLIDLLRLEVGDESSKAKTLICSGTALELCASRDIRLDIDVTGSAAQDGAVGPTRAEVTPASWSFWFAVPRPCYYLQVLPSSRAPYWLRT